MSLDNNLKVVLKAISPIGQSTADTNADLGAKKDTDFEKMIKLRHETLHYKRAKRLVEYEKDSLTSTLHLGVFEDGITNTNSEVCKPDTKLLACGTIVMEDQNDDLNEEFFRIRGMAVSKDFQGYGLGAKILDGLLEHANKTDFVKSIWCNARSSILPFYLKFGFEVQGSEFITDQGIPHFLLTKSITYK